MSVGKQDGRVLRGAHTRQSVLRRAMEIASIDGLDGLSIGRLATDLRVSKSGVFAHFGAKEELQVATVRAAVEIFLAHVVEPAMRTPPGVGRLWRLCESLTAYSRTRVFPGGCFFYAACAEFDAKPGRVRDALAEARTTWMRLLTQTAEDGRQLGELAPDVDVAQLAFELDALCQAANGRSVLHDDDRAYGRARIGMLTRLRACATNPGVLPET